MGPGGIDPFGFVDALWSGLEGPATVAKIRRGAAVLATAPRPPVGLTPHEIVHRHDKLVVRYYPPGGTPGATGGGGTPGATGGTRTDLLPVVVVPSLINKAYICDLEPGRSLVAALAEKGHPTYLIDWGVPGPEDAREDVGYVLLELLHRSIDRIVRHAGGDARTTSGAVHLLGYCMGGTLATMYAALRPERVASLVSLNAPIRFSEGGRFKDLVSAVNVDKAIDDDGLLPVSIMKPAFQLLDPMGNWSKHLALEAASHDPEKLARTLARERWLEENVPMPGAFAREFVKCAYQEDRLLKGTWEIRGETVRLERIACPVLVVACKTDFITPPAAAIPLADAVTGPARTEIVDAGHIGVVVGAQGPKVFYPMLDSFFRDNGAAR
jgi:polyhydroxyalkanoate synthase